MIDLSRLLSDSTYNELSEAMRALIMLRRQELARRKEATVNPDRLEELDAAGRDLSLAMTELENSLYRYNSSRYRVAGRWKRADPDRNDELWRA